MKNKRGWIAVIEAVTGILILFSFLMLSINQYNKEEKGKFDFQDLIFKKIEQNESLREMILKENHTVVNLSLKNLIEKYNKNYNIDVCIIEIFGSCYNALPQKKEIVAMDFFITSTKSEYEPKILRIFIWKKD